ncbi:MAG: hypothetical protein CVU41_08060 [Chloroflexi bacterium HGW-Chloroflexi-3]|nr:MAG: hypothetical protein CVU41_08060 [Chloroflexi bacterium HGW-Chloroflexi-3]
MKHWRSHHHASQSTTCLESNNSCEAGATLENLRWFEVVETRGQIEDNQVAYWQVTIKVGFTVTR